MHDRIRDDTTPVLCKVLKSALVIGTGSRVDIEPKRTVAELPGLRPYDSAFRPVPSLKSTHLPPNPFTRIGFDFTITPPKGHVPPSRLSAASRNKKPAPAAKHLIDKERKKLMRDGKSDPHNNSSLSGEEIIQYLLDAFEVLIPVAISPHGRWGPMFHYFLFGTMAEEHYKFPATRHAAARMYARAMSHPCPAGVIPLATATWKKERPKHQYFYGHSYTCPTPKEYVLQQLGLAISNAVALHLRDVKQGTMVPPTDDEDDDFDSPNNVPSPSTEEEDPDFLNEETNYGTTLFQPPRTAAATTAPFFPPTASTPPGFGGNSASTTTNGTLNLAEYSALSDEHTRRQHNIHLSEGVVVPVQHLTRQSFSRAHSWFHHDPNNTTGELAVTN